MTAQPEQLPAQITEAEFVALYGDQPVAITGAPEGFTVSDALAMEAAFCPADPEKRSDETLRLQQLARYVGETALLPKHRWLLPDPKIK